MSESTPPTSAKPVQVKGIAVQDGVASLRERLGEATFRRVMAMLDTATRELLEGTLLVSEWYPLEALTRLLQAAIAVEAAGGEERLIARSEAVFDRHLHGVYRLFVRLGSPEWIIKKIAVAHLSYFRNVQVSAAFNGLREATVRYTGSAGSTGPSSA